jgi:hypothetical protein
VNITQCFRHLMLRRMFRRSIGADSVSLVWYFQSFDKPQTNKTRFQSPQAECGALFCFRAKLLLTREE